MKTLVFGAFFLVASGSAFAAGPCSSDAAALCSGEKSWPERVRCLEEHQAKLSPACKEHLADMKRRGEAFRADCKAEIGAACLNLQGRALVECLEAQGGKLSKACSDRIADMKGHRRAERIPGDCKDDAEKTCPGVEAGGVDGCLRRNELKLSKECRSALK
jgi:hypothetical protein